MARIDYGTTRNGETQLRRTWSPQGVPRAIFLIVHGISEHCGRYDAVGQQLAAAGFGAVAWDQRGHGETTGTRGHVERFDEFLDDLEDHLEVARRVGVPIVLLGHSMGGLIATAYAVSDRPQPDLLLLSGPALGVGLPKWQRVAVEKFAQLAPRFYLSPPFDTAVLSRDPEVGRAYSADPLIKPGASAQLLAQLFATVDQTVAALDRLTVPTLCLHGGDDELVPTAASEVLDGRPGVERRVLDGLRHEILNEPEGSEVTEQMVAWVSAMLTQSGHSAAD